MVAKNPCIAIHHLIRTKGVFESFLMVAKNPYIANHHLICTEGVISSDRLFMHELSAIEQLVTFTYVQEFRLLLQFTAKSLNNLYVLADSCHQLAVHAAQFRISFSSPCTIYMIALIGA